MAKKSMDDLLKRRMSAAQQASELEVGNEAYETMFQAKADAAAPRFCELPIKSLCPFRTADIGFHPYPPEKLRAFSQQLAEQGIYERINRAQASRRQASRSQRRFFAAREDLHAAGSRITCRMLAVGPRRCLVDCYGYDLDMTQREIRYAAIPDLRTEFHPGSEIDCIVKEYHPRTGELIVSAKETEVNPFFGAEERHPVGSRRFAMISGKYGGGVFCNLPDGVTCMCNYSYQHEDADFMVGEHVMLMVQRYDQEKLQMYGKIMSKW